VEAHALGQRIQVAATIISEKANTFISRFFPPSAPFASMFSNLIIECVVPTGTKMLSEHICGNVTEKVQTLCWFYMDIGLIEPFGISENFNSYITNKFTAHGKRLATEREVAKIVNTERLFSDWKTANNQAYRGSVSLSPAG
jgi:hypothetical protein